MNKVILILFLNITAVSSAQVTATPVFSDPGGTYASPALPPVGNELTLTSPTPSGVISWCYTASSPACTPSTTYTTQIYINPLYPAKDQICANAKAPSPYTVSPTQCYTYQNIAIATGDGRGVQPEPQFPTGCGQIVQATKYIVSTTTMNIDPWNSTCSGGTGILGCSGGTSLEPSLTPSSTGFTNAEGSEDTTLIQTAINSAAVATPPTCVEIVPGTSGQYGLIAGPLQEKSSVTIIEDAGIDIFKSNTPTEFGSNCGKISSSGTFGGSSCALHWICSNGGCTGGATTNAGWMGYGRLNARGWDKFNTNSQCGGLAFCGFDYNSMLTYCNSHSASKWQGVTCPYYGGSAGIAYGPDTFHLYNADNNIIYKTTIFDSANFNIYWGNGGNGFTTWGLKELAPYNHSNTDGWDPSYNVQNATLANSFISIGDNCVAIKSNSSGAATAISILNNQTGSCIGVVYGSKVNGGVTNVLVNGLVQNGNAVNSAQQEGFGSTAGVFGSTDAGAVSNTTFENVCSQNTNQAVYFGTPQSSMTINALNIFNINLLNGNFTLNGYSSGGISGYLSNVVDSVTPTVAIKNSTWVLGPNPVGSNIANKLSGTNVSVSCGFTGTPPGSCSYTNVSPYPCTTSTWKSLIGELLAKTSTNNNAQSITTTAPASFTLQAVLEPAKFPESNYSSSGELPPLGAIASPSTYPVTFYDSLNGGAKVAIGTGQIMANGTLAQLALTGVVAGTHIYSASYSDSYYSTVYNFGSLTAQVNGSSTGTVAGSQFGVILVGP